MFGQKSEPEVTRFFWPGEHAGLRAFPTFVSAQMPKPRTRSRYSVLMLEGSPSLTSASIKLAMHLSASIPSLCSWCLILSKRAAEAVQTSLLHKGPKPCSALQVSISFATTSRTAQFYKVSQSAYYSCTILKETRPKALFLFVTK